QGVESFSNVDAIYVPTDNTVVSGLETVISYGIDNQIQVFAAESDSVERGTVGTYGLKYYEHGRQAGELAMEMMTRGADLEDTPAALADESAMEYTFKLDAAEKMGVESPEELTDESTIVDEDDAADDDTDSEEADE